MREHTSRRHCKGAAEHDIVHSDGLGYGDRLVADDPARRVSERNLSLAGIDRARFHNDVGRAVGFSFAPAEQKKGKQATAKNAAAKKPAARTGAKHG